ncbi:hypothetical protein ACTFIZ_005926 [Dictyostelium cf. discoideum]
MNIKNKNTVGENCHKVAIIGIGFRLPNLKSDLTPNDLWSKLLNKYDGVVKNDRWNDSFYKSGDISTNYAGFIPFEELKSFDPLFFGINPSEFVDKSINELLVENPNINNIDSIFHFAYTQATCNSDEVDFHHLKQSHSAKSMGAINLHNQSIKRNWKLKNFIMSSSITSKTSTANQCGYISSNNVLDAFNFEE